MKPLSLFLSLILLASYSFANAQASSKAGNFYGMPIPDNIDQIEVDDSPYNTLAKMRFATREKPAVIEAYYREKVKADSTIQARQFQKTKILSFTQSGVNKMISITDYSGLADVILQSDKQAQSSDASMKTKPVN